jgi:hypothetical protein
VSQAAGDERNAAWVVLETPLPPEELAAFCRQLESLYRINPFLEFDSWEQAAADRFRADVMNHSNGQRQVLEGRIVAESERAWRIDFVSGPKEHTRFEVVPAGSGSRLTITDEYRRQADGTPVSAEDADRSLHAWGVGVKTFIEREHRWRWLPIVGWFQRRVWLLMKPSARRIMFLILVITVADVALIALGFAIYWLEYGRGPS